MKSLLSLACFIFSFATIGCAQKITEKDIPSAVKKAFTAKFPGAADVKWERENAKEYEAEFKVNNTNVSANFKTDGSWTETETTIPSSELPVAVTSAVNKKYPGAVYGVTEKIEKPGAKILYEVNITANGKKKEIELNPDGVIVK
jgi:hypothetical protein